jgi:aflatoxin B1 aldehyde reductase
MSVYLDYRHDQNQLACSHTQPRKEFGMPKAPITNIIFGTMTLGYRGYGARVHDAATADAMLCAVLEFGHDQLDTCSVYGDGTCEQMLGDLRAAERFGIATRIHSGNNRGHEPENVKRVFKESLTRLKTDKVKILYLVTPDSATPIESTLSAVQELHDEGLFEEFGVSNFSAWQVAQAWEIAARHGWIRPSVYQGMYNAITRAVEPELFKCLANYGIRFHAYNPLAGGAFSKNFASSGAVTAGSRFDSSTAQGKLYRDRYMNDAYLDALAEIHRSCEDHGLEAISVALRWLIHHSHLNAERNDGIIVGASSLEHLRHNLNSATEGPLPTEVLAAIDDAALKAQPKWPPYFSGV